jgi:hypothetical protein
VVRSYIVACLQVLFQATGALSNPEAMGFRELNSTGYLAVCQPVPAATIVSGVRFSSNDATRFPSVILALDQSTDLVPRFGMPLRMVTSCGGTSGEVLVTFPPVEIREACNIWAVVEFPPSADFRRSGADGGAGIAVTDEPSTATRSVYFSDDGSFGEIIRNLDIRLVKDCDGSKSNHSPPADPSTTQTRLRMSGFTFVAPHPGLYDVDIFSVNGRKITSASIHCPNAGHCGQDWQGVRRELFASGMYFLRVHGSQSPLGRAIYVK